MEWHACHCSGVRINGLVAQSISPALEPACFMCSVRQQVHTLFVMYTGSLHVARL
jgi:hypothetical protein